MKSIRLLGACSRFFDTLLVATTLVLAGLVVVHASDPIGVYGRVEKVVMEPTDQAPQRIQVWGVFSVAVPNNRDDYQAPGRGYLYFTLPSNRQLALKEWADLKAVAGTDQIVAFGTRWEQRTRLRKPDERPDAPDPYAMNFGVRKISGRTDYTPIRALLNFKP